MFSFPSSPPSSPLARIFGDYFQGKSFTLAAKLWSRSSGSSEHRFRGPENTDTMKYARKWSHWFNFSL